MDEPGSFGQDELAEAATRAGCEPAHVIGDLHQRHGEAAQGGVGGAHRVERTLSFEFVGRGDKRRSGQGGDLLSDRNVEPGGCVQPGADRRAAGRELVQAGKGLLDACEGVADLHGITGPLLPDGERDGVLQVGAADLDDLAPFVGFALDGGGEQGGFGQQRLLDFLDCGDVHGRREGVVGGLGHIDMVIGVHRLLGAELAVSHLDSAVRQHLIHVHVGLGAGAGLPDEKREVLVQLAGNHLIGGLRDQVGLIFR